ncbi:MAG: acetolactate synthase small subunit [Deltaproteobacteria bacterium]|nr:acetolactate synthase small subunit [Deltaproteobacteria bacterium]PWB67243.1 MAG: acetolactate synthase small subunit [Deltaproteobacteria bacterium]
MKRKKLHTILAFAHNQPGVLYKLLSLVRKKRYNVETITVGHTHVPDISRMTISFSHEDESRIEQILRQIEKITEIPKTEDVTDADVINRELVLLKVRAAQKDRVHVTATAQIFDGKVIHVAPGHMIVELTGKQENLEGTIRVFEEFGILGIARTGATVMHREDEDMGLDRIVLPAGLRRIG